MKLKESEKLEFKKSLAEKEEILETISAFANKKGGEVLVGIDENKDGSINKIVGIEAKGRIIENLTNEIKQNIDPVIFPSIELKKIQSKDVLSIKVEESLVKPVFANGKAFKRVGRSNLKLSVQEIRNLTKTSVNYDFTELICKEAKESDIDKEKIQLFVKESKTQRNLNLESTLPTREILGRLKLLKNKKLTNSAILLFGKNPQKFFLQAVTKAIRFKGTDVTEEMIDFKTFEGDIITQLKQAEDFIFNNIPKLAWVEEGKLERQEKWLYPPRAIREALANAFAHRDYATTSAIQIRIFDDRMEIWNPGSLPGELTPDTLKKKHESVPRNPLIARAFFWIRYVEEVGTGTNKIIKWCKEWNLPEPEFEDTGTSFVLIFKKSKLTKEILAKLSLNERQKTAIEHIKNNGKITNSEYAKINKIGRVSAFKELSDLVNKGIIKPRGKGRSLNYVLVSD